MEQVNIIGIDLAKRTFQLHGVRGNGGVVFRRQISRQKLLTWPSSRVASSPWKPAAVRRATLHVVEQDPDEGASSAMGRCAGRSRQGSGCRTE